MEAIKGGFEDWVMQIEFLGAVGQSKKFAVIDWRMFMDMWRCNYPSGPNDPYMTQTSVCQIGKSFQLKLGDTAKITGLHILQLAFVEDKESIPPSKIYAIVPWQTYLDVRKAFLESSE